MEPKENDAVKLTNMIMCGDHPSFTKSELNVKESKMEANKDKEKATMSRTRISPTASRVASRTAPGECVARARSLDLLQRPDLSVASGQHRRTLMQAALGTSRWPPWLLALWVAALVLAHALHGLVGLLERALPGLRKFCKYFQTWAEDSWKTETSLNHRLYPIGLACLTGLLYTLYFGLYALYCIAVWAIEPLCSEMEDKRIASIMEEPKITNYIEEVNSKINSSIKQ